MRLEIDELRMTLELVEGYEHPFCLWLENVKAFDTGCGTVREDAGDQKIEQSADRGQALLYRGCGIFVRTCVRFCFELEKRTLVK